MLIDTVKRPRAHAAMSPRSSSCSAASSASRSRACSSHAAGSRPTKRRRKLDALCDEALLPAGAPKELRPLLGHGIGIHHAGILPRYKQLVEQLALERLIKFVVSTETIAAGINLPARTVVFPSLRKFIKQQPRLITAGRVSPDGRARGPAAVRRSRPRDHACTRAGRAISRRSSSTREGPRTTSKSRAVYGRARNDAQRKGDVIWTPELHQELVKGEPAELRSKTKITAEQVLAIGLPDLAEKQAAGAASRGCGWPRPRRRCRRRCGSIS